MDARRSRLEEQRQQILDQLVQVDMEIRKLDGLFDTVPHYQQIEDAAHRSAQELSQAIQRQACREVAVIKSDQCACPWCGRETETKLITRTIQSADGPVEVIEPHGTCTACRRSFFPSA